MIYRLTPAEHDELNALALTLETNSADPRRLAAEILLLRKLRDACRYQIPIDMPAAVTAALTRIPLDTQTKAWADLAAPEFKQLDLAGK